MEYENDIIVTEKIAEETEEPKKQSQKSFFVTSYKEPDLEEDYSTKDFKNYNSTNLNKVYDKYNVIQTYAPKKEKIQKRDLETFVSEQSNFEPEKETVLVEKTALKQSFKLKSSAKVWLASFVAIICMLIGLGVYNTVQIQNLNTQINQTQNGITEADLKVDKLIKDIGKLTDEDTVRNEAGELDLSVVPPEDVVTITLAEKNELPTYAEESNFFDKICNFFRNLFGG